MKSQLQEEMLVVPMCLELALQMCQVNITHELFAVMVCFEMAGMSEQRRVRDTYSRGGGDGATGSYIHTWNKLLLLVWN